MSMPTCPSCIYASGVCKKTGVPIRRTTGCTYHTPKPQTNADKIRGMTDEELADWVWGAESSGRAYGPRGKKAWLDWLKEEAVNG